MRSAIVVDSNKIPQIPLESRTQKGKSPAKADCEQGDLKDRTRLGANTQTEQQQSEQSRTRREQITYERF
jgi:hypothetical protein